MEQTLKMINKIKKILEGNAIEGTDVVDMNTIVYQNDIVKDIEEEHTSWLSMNMPDRGFRLSQSEKLEKIFNEVCKETFGC